MMLFNTLDTEEKAQKFRKKRMKKIHKGKVWGPRDEAPLCVLHWLPVSEKALFGPGILSPVGFSKFIGIQGKTIETPNLDGVRFAAIVLTEGDGRRFFWNAQIFHSGAMEMVFALSLYEKENGEITKRIYPKPLTENLWNVMDGFKACMSSFGIDVPVMVGISFFNVMDHSFISSQAPFYSGDFDIPPRSDRKKIILPGAVMENLDGMKHIERPIFDMLWRSFGHEQCPYYDDDGNRRDIR